MKVVIKDDLIILFLNKDYISTLDLTDKETIHNYLKQLLLKLQNNYDLDFNGFYNMNLYIDKYYGVIIEVKKEELEYLDYFTSTEINTKIIEDSFLYEITNIDDFNNNNYQIYTYKNHIYIKINNQLKSHEIGSLLEHTLKIIYGKERNKIIKKAKEVIICENP